MHKDQKQKDYLQNFNMSQHTHTGATHAQIDIPTFDK
jgi:hypothetical protein